MLLVAFIILPANQAPIRITALYFPSPNPETVAMNQPQLRFLLLVLLLPMLLVATTAQQRRATTARSLLVISVDGLDYRYLRDADKLGLKIPHLRKLLREGEVTEGIEGVFPTVTWPSHTTLITGVAPAEHGILGNRRPTAEGGDYYWDVWRC